MTDELDIIEIKPFKEIDIDSFFVFETEEIEMAYRISSLLHKGAKNIVAGGNEVEVAIRNFFKRKLTNRFYTTNGHVVDNSMKVSPQFDIILADNNKSPTLYKSKDNTEFLIYESIYCIGEVKKSWYKSSLLQEYSSSIKRMRNELNRAKVDPRFVDIGGKGAMLNVRTTEHPYKNPLLYFMFFVQSDAMNFSDIRKLLNSNSWADIPNIICLLDKGLIVNISKTSLRKGEIKINLYPEFLIDNNQDENDWALIKFDSKANTLAYFYMLIMEHLNTVVLETPSMLTYLKNMFNIGMKDINFINQ
jgi:hypothetical protein